MSATGALFQSPFRRIKRIFRAAAGRLRQSSCETRVPQSDRVRFEIGDAVNDHWNDDDRGYVLSERKKGLLNSGSRIFTIGSCFAEQVRQVLRQREFNVYPKYREIPFDPARQQISGLPERDNVNHYDTYTILQEFERAFAEELTSTDDLCVRNSPTRKPFGTKLVHVDPYRKMVLGVDAASALDASRKVDTAIRYAIQNCDVYIITLGLIECWRNTRNGRYVYGLAMKKTSLAPDLEFHHSTFADNHANMQRLCDLVFGRYPDRHIVVTVSPVALRRTFSGSDVVVANMESKSVLRSVAGQLAREYENVHYWPSFEVATKQDIFLADGRHVSAEGVSTIMDNFLRAYAA